MDRICGLNNPNDESGPCPVTLSAAKGLARGVEMLRFAQHDRDVTPTEAQSIVFICMIVPIAD